MYEEFDILKPFKLSNFQYGLIIFTILILMYFLFILLVNSFFIIIPSILLFTPLFFENKLYPTKIIGKLIITEVGLKAENFNYDFTELKLVKVKKYFTPYKSFLPSWKWSDIIEIQNKNGEYAKIVISRGNDLSKRRIYDVLEKLQKKNVEFYRLIKIIKQ